jgi:putative (di)nucleoside polyphosphate hydrolase
MEECADRPRTMIDADGYRLNVGIVLSNHDHHVFWARRVGMEAWQFPQGGIRRQETPEMAMFRELREEIGLDPWHVKIIGCTRDWLRYQLPKRYVRYHRKPVCIGQKQIWFMLRLVGTDSDVRLDRSARPEFDSWQWVSYWRPLDEVVEFKRAVYQAALQELEPLLTTASGANADKSTHIPIQLTPSGLT